MYAHGVMQIIFRQVFFNGAGKKAKFLWTGNKGGGVGMEASEVILILGIVGAVLATSMWVFSRVNPAKSAKKQGYDSIKSMYEVYDQQVQDVLKIKDNQIKRLNQKINSLEAEYEEEPEDTSVKYDDLKALAKEKGINPALLDMPFVKKQIQKYTKGMSMEEVLEIANQFGLLKGNKQSKSNSSQEIENQSGYF